MWNTLARSRKGAARRRAQLRVWHAQSMIRYMRLGCERLEDRRLLSVAPHASAASIGPVQLGEYLSQGETYSVPSLADWNADGIADLLVGRRRTSARARSDSI